MHRLITFVLLMGLYVSSHQAVTAQSSRTETAKASLKNKKTHGYALHSSLKYPAYFRYFDYVNPYASKGGQLVLAELGTFDSLNPFIIKGIPAAGLSLLFPSLLHVTLLSRSLDEPFARYCYLAESMLVADDHSSVTFYLRPQATFHDGTPITADDVVFSFNTLTRQGHPLFQSYYKDVKQVEKIDALTVKFTFSTTKNLELPLILGDMPIISAAYYQIHPFGQSTLVPPLGSGPYKIVDVKAGHHITYERINNWWGCDLQVNQGLYNFDYRRYDYYRDDTIAFEAFKSGAVDFRLENVAKNWAAGYNFPRLSQQKVKRETVKFHNPRPMQGLVFNTRRPFFQDLKVRQALTLCFDFEWMNKNLFYGLYERSDSYFVGSELAATGLPSMAEQAILAPYQRLLPADILTTAFVLPKTDGTGNPRSQLIQAQKLLQAAGYEVRDGKLISSKDGQPVKLTLLIQSPAIERIFQGFVLNLKKIGIEASIQMADTAQYTNRLQTYDYDMIFHVYPQSLSPGNEQVEFWHSKTAHIPGGFNYAGIKNPVIDGIIEKLIATSMRQDLINHTHVLDRLLLQGYYMIPGYHSPTYNFVYSALLKHPDHFPQYEFSIETWWMDPVAFNSSVEWSGSR